MAKLITLRMQSFGIYDALMVAAALEAGCAILIFRRFQVSLTIDGQLAIRNPFARSSGG